MEVKHLGCSKCGSLAKLVVNVFSGCKGCLRNGEWNDMLGEYAICLEENSNGDQVEKTGECLMGPASGCGCMEVYCMYCCEMKTRAVFPSDRGKPSTKDLKE